MICFANIITRRMSIPMKSRIQKWAAPAVCGLLLFLCMKFVFFIGYVPTVSMEPTIAAGSYVLGTRIHGELQRDNIVVFRIEGQNLVKRIAAVPGDIVLIEGGAGLEVPEGYFYMLGDNLSESIDSRHWDNPFIHESAILARLWPSALIQSNYQTPTTSRHRCLDISDVQTRFLPNDSHADDTSLEAQCQAQRPE